VTPGSTHFLVEASLPKIAVEAMGKLEARSTDGKPQRGRQVENAEVRLGENQLRIVVSGDIRLDHRLALRGVSG
jgi:hypothetical protein